MPWGQLSLGERWVLNRWEENRPEESTWTPATLSSSFHRRTRRPGLEGSLLYGHLSLVPEGGSGGLPGGGFQEIVLEAFDLGSDGICETGIPCA